MGEALAKQVFSFTDWVKDHPSDRLPGDRVDAQFANHQRAINELTARIDTLLRADGKINNNLLTPESFPRGVLEEVVAFAMAEARQVTDSMLSLIRRFESRVVELDALAASLQARAALNSSEFSRAIACSEAAMRVQHELKAQLVEAVERVERRSASLSTPLPRPPALGPNTGGFYAGDVEGADATAADYAQVAIEWAEHLPDSIPPNVLAINAITGEHWSSRWWAIRAAGAFGVQAMWYQGAFGDPGPPTTPLTPTGDPIPPGAMYWNTDHNQMMVWDGSSWGAVGVPAAASSSSLFYEAVDGQTQFATTDPDIIGQSFMLRPDGSNGVNVFLNGIRLTFTRDYAVDAPTSTIALSTPAIGGSILALDVLVPQKDIAPGGVSIHKCRTLAPFDGSTTSFELQTTDGALLVVNGSNELLVVLDGVQQEPGVDYSATGDTLSFAAAPGVDAKSFILWYTPVSEPAP